MACLPNKPMSYLLFKLNLEMAYVSTFERDWWGQEQYDKYLSDFYITQKKREGLINPPENPPTIKKDNNPNSSR